MNNFKIIFTTPLTYSQLKEVYNFIELQQTTDRVQYSQTLYYKGDEADYLIILMLDDGEIKTITITIL